MSDLFLFLFLISFCSIFIFFIKPSLLRKWFHLNFSRKKIFTIFSSATFIFFILFGITLPEIENNELTDANQPEVQILDDQQESSEESIASEVVADEQNLFLVTRVVDGDTIELETGDKVRYIGIDTPETKHPTKDVECYGKEASLKNKELVEGKEVRLEKDVSETDRYGRLLRYVYVGDLFVNYELVAEGYAQSSSYPPDIKHQDKFKEAEAEARKKEKGLWSSICDIYVSPTPTLTTKLLDKVETIVTPTIVKTTTGGSYSCSCSKTCSQMSSCEEAYYQLNNCGCSVRDGDHDGVPCEVICPGG
jgi:micrococcal nuclease